MLQAIVSVKNEDKVKNGPNDQLTHQGIKPSTNKTSTTSGPIEIDLTDLEDTENTSSLCVSVNSDKSSNIEHASKDISCSDKEGSNGLCVNETDELLKRLEEILNTVSSRESRNSAETVKERKQNKDASVNLSSFLNNQDDPKPSNLECRKRSDSLSSDDSVCVITDQVDSLGTARISDRINTDTSKCDENDRHEGSDTDQIEAWDSCDIISDDESISPENDDDHPSEIKVCESCQRGVNLP